MAKQENFGVIDNNNNNNNNNNNTIKLLFIYEQTEQLKG
jgi:hypothetical protein